MGALVPVLVRRQTELVTAASNFCSRCAGWFGAHDHEWYSRLNTASCCLHWVVSGAVHKPYILRLTDSW